jgi:hypothetical protein
MVRNSKIHEILRNTDSSTWILVRKLKNVEKETQKLYELEYEGNH